MTVEFSRRITKEERVEWSRRGSEETILHAEAAGIINWALRLSSEEVTAVFKTMPERVRLANLDAALFNNPLMEWMLDKLRPDSGAAEQIGVKREFREYGAVLYEHSKDCLCPNYLTWCRENGRESVALQRFSESLLDAAQTQRAQVRKGRASDGATKIFGLRFRADFETSWLEILQTSGGEGLL